MLVDSHCHLNYKGLVEDQGSVLSRARASGVTAMLNISTRESEWDEVLALAEQESDVWASVGIHPHEADAHPEIDAAKLITRAAHPRIIAIGETGLDYYYDKSDREQQRISFRSHIAAARETGSIARDSYSAGVTSAFLASEMSEAMTLGLHCFCGMPSRSMIRLTTPSESSSS